MVKILSGGKIKCKRCLSKKELTSNDFGKPTIGELERNFDYEKDYTWKYTVNCGSCNSTQFIVIEAWEYPREILNYQSIQANGCIFLENPILIIDESI